MYFSISESLTFTNKQELRQLNSQSKLIKLHVHVQDPLHHFNMVHVIYYGNTVINPINHFGLC